MKISNANPLQFWDYNGGVPLSFNEREICGITPVCYFHKVICSDIITIQVQLDPSDVIADYNWIIVDKDDNSVGAFGGVYGFNDHGDYADFAVQFSVLAPDYCNELLQIQIVKGLPGPKEIQFQTDLLDVKSEHPCTLRVRYSNASNFAGIQYDIPSPPTFILRIPAVFFHENYPREDEVIELSTREFIRTYSRIESKKLLEIGFLPPYLWKKIHLIFAHDFIKIDDGVIIDEEQWVLKNEDSITVVEGHKTYPLRKGSAWLTEKDFVKRNLL